MSGTGEKIGWYLARDGQQFGPLSDGELHKVIELGHLRPDDLLWRDGWDDWQNAEAVFPQDGTDERDHDAAKSGKDELRQASTSDAEAAAADSTKAGGEDEAKSVAEEGGEGGEGADKQTTEAAPQDVDQAGSDKQTAAQDAGALSEKPAETTTDNGDNAKNRPLAPPRADAKRSDGRSETSDQSDERDAPAAKAAAKSEHAPTTKPAKIVDGSKAADGISSQVGSPANGSEVAASRLSADDAQGAATPRPQQQQEKASRKTAARPARQNPNRGAGSRSTGQPGASQQNPRPGSAQSQNPPASLGPSANRQPANGRAAGLGPAQQQPQRHPPAPGQERLGPAPQAPGQAPLQPLAPAAADVGPSHQGRAGSQVGGRQINQAAPAVAGAKALQPMAPQPITPRQMGTAVAGGPPAAGTARARPRQPLGQSGHAGIATAPLAPAPIPLEPIAPAAMAAQTKPPPPRKSALRRIATRLILLGAIGGGSWLAYAHGSWLGPMAKQYYKIAYTQTSSAATKVVTIVKSLTSQAKPSPTKTAKRAPQNSVKQQDQTLASDSGTTGTLKRIALAEPVANPTGTGDGTASSQAPPGTSTAPDAMSSGAIMNPLEGSPLWRYIQQEFPEWYAKRAREAVSLKANIKDDHMIQRLMAQKLLALRQEHAAVALTSSPEHLKAVAASFLTNLQVLNKHSVKACYGFISNGEFHPAARELMDDPAYSRYLDAQTLAILHAAVDGTRNSTQHDPPKPADYRALGTELMARGWTIDDLKLFTDPVALSAAAPDKVCRMVQTWFAAQLALPDSDAQLRLLVQSLRSMIAS